MFLEAPLLRQAEGELKNISVIVEVIEVTQNVVKESKIGNMGLNLIFSRNFQIYSIESLTFSTIPSYMTPRSMGNK